MRYKHSLLKRKSNGQGHRFFRTVSGCAAVFISSCFEISLLILQRTLRAFCRYFFNELLDLLNTRDIFFDIWLIIFYLYEWCLIRSQMSLKNKDWHVGNIYIISNMAFKVNNLFKTPSNLYWSCLHNIFLKV